MIKRLAIYVIYDKDGIIDDYISYYLNELKKCVSHIAVVCNGTLSDPGRKKLECYTEDIFVRDNTGLDAGAVQDVLLNLYGWDSVYEYDELLIANDTVYGPLYPFERVFNEMDERECDFWGITEHQGNTRYVRHLQCYFLNIKQKMLKSTEFRDFWQTYIPSDDYFTTVADFEAGMSKRFHELGYKSSVLLDTEYYGEFDIANRDPGNLLRRYGTPLLKRKALGQTNDDDIDFFGNEKKKGILKYIEQNTNYDTNLIWDNLLRKYNVTGIKNALCLEYVLPLKALLFPECNHNGSKTAVIVHLYYEHLLRESLGYIDNVPMQIDVIITASKPEIADLCRQHFEEQGRKNFEIRIVENRGRDVAALIIGCKDIFANYEYVCFTHDKQSLPDTRKGESFSHIIRENTLGSGLYINNILSTFQDNPRLGFLSTPTPYHSIYFRIFNNYWDGDFDNVNGLAEKLGLQCNLSEDVPVFSIGTAFWCRTAALRPLFEHGFVLTDFPQEPIPGDGTLSHAIERIFPYVAQHTGYYSGIMMSDSYAETRIVDLETILFSIMGTNLSRCGLHSNLTGFIFSNNNIINVFGFCKRHNNIYIYGTGMVAEKVNDLLIQWELDFQGFIISDGHEKKCGFSEKPVFRISDLDLTGEDSGIILGLNKDNTYEVAQLLDTKGIKNYLKIIG